MKQLLLISQLLIISKERIIFKISVYLFQFIVICIYGIKNILFILFKDNEEDWKDLLIIYVVEGLVFWVQVGIEIIQNVQKIQVILNVYWKNGVLEYCGCEKGDNRVVLQIIEDEVCSVRMIVKEVNIRGVCGWVMDGGQEIQIDQKYVFVLFSEVCLEVYFFQVFFCCLDGKM